MSLNKNKPFPLNSKKEPTFKGSWKGYSGDCDSDVYGIAVPDGCVVIDLDSYKDDCDLEGLQAKCEGLLGCALDWSDAYLQTTPRGGKHYLFALSSGVRLINTKNLMGQQGIDIRSPEKGYIASGAGYRCGHDAEGLCELFDDPGAWFYPDLPEEAVERLRANQRDVGSFEVAIANDATLDLSDDEVRSYVMALDPVMASTHWLTVLMAIYHQTRGSEWGWELADEWSKLAPDQYNLKGNRSRWESLENTDKDSLVTFSTVIWLAGGLGAITDQKVRDACQRLSEVETQADYELALLEGAKWREHGTHDTLLAAAVLECKTRLGETCNEAKAHKLVVGAIANSGYQGDPDFWREHVFDKSTDKYVCVTNGSTASQMGFNSAHAMDVPPDRFGVRCKANTYFERMGGVVVTRCDYRPDKLTKDDIDSLRANPCQVDLLTYHEDGQTRFNTYQPPKHVVIPFDEAKAHPAVVRFQSHLSALIASEDEAKIILEYIAHNVQFPGKKINWVPVLYSQSEGNGKSTVWDYVRRMIGDNNCSKVVEDSLLGQYTDYLRSSHFVINEEIKARFGSEVASLNKLKTLVTDPKIDSNFKYGSKGTITNVVNIAATSNHDNAIPVDDNDRRFFIVECRSFEEMGSPGAKYFNQLFADRSQVESLAALYSYFWQVEISDGFLALERAPSSQAKREMGDSTLSSDVKAFKFALSHFHAPGLIDERVIHVKTLMDKIQGALAGGGFDDLDADGDESGKVELDDEDLAQLSHVPQPSDVKRWRKISVYLRKLGYRKETVRLDGGNRSKAWFKPL